MSKYKLIIEYYLKGNNRTQIATLCDCSRMTVWRVLQRVNAIGTVHCEFDSGRSLGLIDGEDDFRALTAQELAEDETAHGEDTSPVLTM